MVLVLCSVHFTILFFPQSKCKTHIYTNTKSMIFLWKNHKIEFLQLSKTGTVEKIYFFNL